MQLSPLTLILSLSVLLASLAQADEDKLAPYSSVGSVAGSLNSIGSDTLNNLMAQWTESFKAKYPNVKTQVEGKGSSTAPPALIEGTAQLGPMSRMMKSKEIDKFEQKFGYKPTPVRVAIDALAIYVHRDNPVKGLTLAQVDAVFSASRERGANTGISQWGQAGLNAEWADRRLSLYGRNSSSGTYGYFKKIVLKNADYLDTVKEQPGSASVVQSIAADLGGIGYSGIGYRTSGVRTVPLGDGSELFAPTLENCLTSDYPLARFLLVYVNKEPGKPLDTLTYEFLRFVLSAEGQEIVTKDGYYALPGSVANAMLAELK